MTIYSSHGISYLVRGEGSKSDRRIARLERHGKTCRQCTSSGAFSLGTFKMGENEKEYVTWLCWPQDVLHTLKVLLREYSGTGQKTGVPPLRQQSIRKAYRILGMAIGQDESGAQTWYINKYWRERLGCAGLDPETLEVRDPLRWAIAWEHLRDYHFRVTAINNSVAMKEFVQPEEALKPHVARLPKRKSGQPMEIKTVAERELDEKEREALEKKYGGG